MLKQVFFLHVLHLRDTSDTKYFGDKKPKLLSKPRNKIITIKMCSPHVSVHVRAAAVVAPPPNVLISEERD